MAADKQLSKVVLKRCMTVCGEEFDTLSGRRFVFFPSISLSGKWLQDSGFKIGHSVNITCEAGKLTVTLSKEQQ